MTSSTQNKKNKYKLKKKKLKKTKKMYEWRKAIKKHSSLYSRSKLIFSVSVDGEKAKQKVNE